MINFRLGYTAPMTHRLLVALVCLLAPAVASPTTRADEAPPPVGTHTELGLQGSAKVLCSAVFVSNRDPEEFARNSGFWFMPDDQADQVKWTVDRERKVVTTSVGTTSRSARYYGDQGCIIDRAGKDGIEFTPVPVRTTLPDAMTQDWPMGDRLPASPLPADIDQAQLDCRHGRGVCRSARHVRRGWSSCTSGRLVGERYMPGITKDTQLESWSMGKSITSTLFALLVKDGTYTLEQRAPVPEWQKPGDPRGAIRNIDLLRMSSGLRFIATQDRRLFTRQGLPGSLLHLHRGGQRVRLLGQRATAVSGEHRGPLPQLRSADDRATGEAGGDGARRGVPHLAAASAVRSDRHPPAGARDRSVRQLPADRLRLRDARNWARLGLLYLQDGMWQGTRILPEGWARFVSTPAPAWKRGNYGGLFWINGAGEWKLPKDAYFMAGAGGQWTFVVPSHDLVVVRMGHYRGAAAGQRALNRAFELLLPALRR